MLKCPPVFVACLPCLPPAEVTSPVPIPVALFHLAAQRGQLGAGEGDVLSEIFVEMQGQESRAGKSR